MALRNLHKLLKCFNDSDRDRELYKVYSISFCYHTLFAYDVLIKLRVIVLRWSLKQRRITSMNRYGRIRTEYRRTRGSNLISSTIIEGDSLRQLQECIAEHRQAGEEKVVYTKRALLKTDDNST